MAQEYTRIIETGLENTKVNSEMIASVVGQLSDGAWENVPQLQGYWIFAECNSGSANIAVSERWSDSHYRTVSNPYKAMDDVAIKKFFAYKIKQLVKMELKDKYEEEVQERFYKAHGIPMDWRYVYPTSERERVAACDRDIKDFLEKYPFSFRGKFRADNNEELVYLSYNSKVTVGDAYKAYKVLTA